MKENNPMLAGYHQQQQRRWLIVGLLAASVLAAGLIAMCVGAARLGPLDSLRALLGGDDTGALIVRQLRLPRILMGGGIGAGLALGGAVCQATLRNPLASPFTLGVASGAAFGAVLGILSGAGPLAIAAAAFVVAMLTALVTLGIARARRSTPETLILAGVALMFLFSAFTSLLQYLGTMEQVQAIVFWMFGSLSKTGWREVALTAPMILLPGLWLLRHAWDLNLLTAGDDTARALGVPVKRLRRQGLLLAALMCAGAICFTGVVGFVGLVAPHLGRMLLGADHRQLLPASALLGALLVLAADTLGRTLWAPLVIPLGIMTAFIGVPFFLWLLLRRAGGGI